MDKDNLHSEINDLKGFIADLKADRAAQKEKEQREAWTKYVSLTVVIIAVFAAIATQWAGKYSSRMLAQLNNATYSQAQAANQWAYYQAKSIKQNLYEISFSQAPKNGNGATNRLKDFEAKIAKYEQEKKEIMAVARQHEKDRDDARIRADVASGHGAEIGLAVSLFSVSIAMASISIVTKKKPLWIIAMILAFAAAANLIKAWVL